MEHGDRGLVSVEVGIVDRDSPGIVLERRLQHDADVYCVRSGTIGRLSFARSWIGADLDQPVVSKRPVVMLVGRGWARGFLLPGTYLSR